ncbi:MAG: NAD(P)/FAD-dependent oxidoreductase [Muribaculaceae bacterium]|nr:NAD(P)/FAD-dependent oxidoreductase [Muribaculaceae bacterium]
MYKDITLRISPRLAASHADLLAEAARVVRVSPREIHDLCIVRRSVDARKHPVMLNLSLRLALGDDRRVDPIISPISFSPVPTDAPVIIIVGAGPAGLFAALKAITLGLRPIIFERGRDVDARRRDLAQISRQGVINPISNYCFGEGGAGAYSDGKLFTRSKKRGSVEEILQIFVQHGADPSILVDAHPHIGSDRLPHIIKSIRHTIISCGGEVHFEAHVDDIIIEDGKAVGVVVAGTTHRADALILATGHSAHDTFRTLHQRGVAISAKGIAVGVRLEHPQHLIDCIQYHNKAGRGEFLPAAEYAFVTQVDGRGVYSFCMCPGGVVVPAAAADGELVVNGMSASARAGRFANSGMVVEIRPGDFPEFADKGPLEMLALQEWLEHRFFEAAGNSIVAPAQRMLDFVEGRLSPTIPDTSYAPGIQSADFNTLLPSFIASRLADGFREFGRKARGFLTNDATMIGLESRTSSPIRVDRDNASLCSCNIARLFPAGEGAGYAGGIVSAAIDGMRCAQAANDALSSSPDNP